MFDPLYNEKTVKKKFSDVVITKKQRKVAKEWLSKLKNNELEKEKANYFIFRDMILRDLLNYPEEDIKFEDKRVEFSVTDIQGTTHVCFEAKGTKTKDLFAYQHYEKSHQEHPVLQTMMNMERFPASYGVCTNYRKFVLLDKNLGITKCHRFDFYDIENNEEKLREFIGIFSYQKLVQEKYLVTLYKSSVTEEKDFTDEFYKLFHETRLMLIKAFQEKTDVTTEQAIHFAQLFLNRLIFVFFQEDKRHIEERLFTKRIQKILETGQCTEYTKAVYSDIVGLFQALQKGSEVMGIFGYNGGLFEEQVPAKIYFYDIKDPDFFNDVKQNSKFSKKMKLDEFLMKTVKQYKGKLSPIVTNLLLMDSFDFRTDINVNILGHIFEQSISDLEELKEKITSRRKSDGVYYTPEYITKSICENTIIPYLSQTGSTTVDELILEYEKNIDVLEERIKKIKILDPACGSGAFLIKAVEILLEIDEKIQMQKPTTMEQRGLEEWSVEREITKIIENNIFGVDINSESVEVTKLSLFIKMTTVDRKLIDLSKNIRMGNSIIDEKKIDPAAFDWKNEFKEVFDSGGFDIIIGNPPWSSKIPKSESKILAKRLGWDEKNVNICALFIAISLEKLKQGGFFGFLLPKVVIKNTAYTPVRKNILHNFFLCQIGDFGQFPGVASDTVSWVIQKTASKNKTKISFYDRSEIISENLVDRKLFSKNASYIFSLSLTPEIQNILDKIEKDCDSLYPNFCLIKRGIETGQKSNIVKCIKCGNYNEADFKYYSPSEKKCKKCDSKLDLKNKFLVSSLEKNKKYTEKCISGNQLKQYRILQNYFIPAILKGISYKEDAFSGDKILLKRISTKIEGTFSDESLLAFNTVYSLYNKKLTRSEFLMILGILNSSLMNFHYEYSYNVGMNLTTQVTIDFLKTLPIKLPVNEKIKSDLINSVQKILHVSDLIKRDQGSNLEFEKLREKIDGLVFQVYSINEQEKDLIKKSISLD